jgi:hypothetical protein
LSFLLLFFFLSFSLYTVVFFYCFLLGRSNSAFFFSLSLLFIYSLFFFS